MNIYFKANSHRTISGLFVLLVSLGCLSGCALGQAQPQPPEPKEPVTTLRMPEPVETVEAEGRATLPEESMLEFEMDVTDVVLAGDWDIEGKVIALEDQTMVFETERGETGHLAYRLPEGMRLPLRPEQPISIRRSVSTYGASLSYELQVTSERDLALASGRVYSDRPQEVEVSGGVFLRQIGDRKSVLNESRYETIYQVPASLIFNGETVMLPIGKATKFTWDGEVFWVMVTDSTEVVPSEEYGGVAEGRGYILEYVLTPGEG